MKLKPPAPPLPLAQQKDDFTAEGAPPPGRVANERPATPPPKPKGPAKRGAQARYR
jgi:hypothetical protein